MSTEQTKTPNLDKMLEVKEQAAALQEFLDWYVEDYHMTKTYAVTLDENSTERSREQVMAEYFGIDLKEMEAERMRLLTEVRDTNRKRDILKKRKARATR